MTGKVKVLELLPGLNYGGAQTMIVNLCANIDYDQVQCDFAIDHGEFLNMKELVGSFGATVHVMPAFKGSNLKEIREAWDRFFSEHDYDIIHCHIRSYASIIIAIARKHGVKTIIHSHNTSNGKGLGSVVRYFLQLPLRHSADYFFACSREAGEWLFGQKITIADNFHVINNAIDTARFTYDPKIRNKYRKMFELKDEKVFIQVGRMAEQKNYLFTLEVFQKYLSADKDARLFIVGDGELESIIRDKINELKINDNVTILQHRDDVAELLQMADIFLMPSLYEGLSVACIEAQSSGILCLCSDRVDRNVAVTDRCRFLRLDHEVWLKEMRTDPGERTNRRKQIAAAGFSAAEKGKWLQEFYRSIV